MSSGVSFDSKVIIGLPRISPVRVKLTRTVICIPGRAILRGGGIQQAFNVVTASRIVFIDNSRDSTRATLIVSANRITLEIAVRHMVVKECENGIIAFYGIRSEAEIRSGA
jgi:hypothetical protein